jgi:hypothetical protein
MLPHTDPPRKKPRTQGKANKDRFGVIRVMMRLGILYPTTIFPDYPAFSEIMKDLLAEDGFFFVL